MRRCIIASLLVAMAFAGHVPAAGPGTWLRRDNLGKLTKSVDVGGQAYCDRDAAPRGRPRETLSWLQYGMTASVPVAQVAGQYDVSVTGRFRRLSFDRGALRLPTTQERFPRRLYDIGFGVVARTAVSTGMLGFHLDVGSPSDRPFASLDETAIMANAFWRVPYGEHTAWLFLLNYSNVREFCENVPLPGVGFLYEPDRTLNVLAGLPMSRVRWQPLTGLTLEAHWMMVRNVHLKVSYEIVKDVSLYAAFDWDSQRFLLRDRRDDDDRLFYYEKRLRFGVRWQITKHLFADAFTGYAFDRFWYEDDDYDGRGRNRVDLDDGPLAGVQLGVRW